MNSSQVAEGGGVSIHLGEATITGVTITQNQTNRWGGGIHLNFTTAVSITNSNIRNNGFTSGATTPQGGGMFIGANSPMTSVTDSCLVGNTSTSFYSELTSTIANNNWWGASTGPNTTGADTTNLNVGTSYKTTEPVDCTQPLSDAIFSDGFEGGSLSAWSSSSTDAGNLSVSTAAVMFGTRGMQALVNDNNPLWVRDETPNAEKRYRARFYFKPNGITMATNDQFILLYGYAAADFTTGILQVEMRYSGGYQIRAGTLSDTSVWSFSNWLTISNAQHYVEFDWRAATAVGANNGGLTLWLDGVQQANFTTIDNDTRAIDRIHWGTASGIDTGTRGTMYFDDFVSRRFTYIGPASGGSPTPTPTPSPTPTPTPTLQPNDPIFSDSFETGNLSRWSSSSTDAGNLSVTTGAVIVGSYGMQALVNDNNSLWVRDETPNAEKRYRARFYFKPNSISMVTNDQFALLYGYAAANYSVGILQVEMRYSGGYQIRAGTLSDTSVWSLSNWLTISNALHYVEFDWRAATAAGANNGVFTLWLDGVQQANFTTIDNDTRVIDRIHWGAASGIDAGTRGTMYFDDFVSQRYSYIGESPICPAAGAVIGASLALLCQPLPTLTPTPTFTPTPSPTPSFQDFGITFVGTWSAAEQADILIAANEVGKALVAKGAAPTAVEAFREVMRGWNGTQWREIRFGRITAGGPYCTTTKNPTSNVAAYIDCDSSVIMNQYTAVHEFGHVFVGRTTVSGASSYLAKVENPGGAGLPLLNSVARFVMGPRNLPIQGRTLSDWQRSDYVLDNGWGNAAQWDQTTVYEYAAPVVPPPTPTGFPIRIPAIGPCGNGAPPNLPAPFGTPFPFQQNACTFSDEFATSSEGLIGEFEEAAADMFLNWVYWKNYPTATQRGFLDFRWRFASYTGGNCYPAGCPDSDLSGQARQNWMEQTMSDLFVQFGW